MKKRERRFFELTDAQLAMVMKCGEMSEPGRQKMIDAAWKQIAFEQGFVWNTVLPIVGMPDKHITAEVIINEPERKRTE